MNQRNITFIGGGGGRFVREVVVGLFSYPHLQDSHIVLMDVNRERVERSERIVKRIIQELKIPASVSSTPDQRQATRSLECGAQIIQALEGGTAEAFYGNVLNNGLIENLPGDCVTEVPCLANRNGIVSQQNGKIPAKLAAVMRPHIALHDLTVTGTLEIHRRLVYQAAQSDPLKGAILTLPKIKELVDEMFMANKEYAVDWR